MRSYPFALRLAAAGDLFRVHKLVSEAAEWLRTSKDTDQWAKPWPDRARRNERMLNDLLKGKTDVKATAMVRGLDADLSSADC